MLAVAIFAIALAVALLVTATWGLDQRRAYRASERRRANAFAVANLAAEREQHHRIAREEALRRLRAAHLPHIHATDQRDLHSAV